FLNNDLLRLLCSNTSERHGLHGLLDEGADLHGGIDVMAVVQAHLALRDFELLGIVGENLPAAKCLVVAALAVDRDTHIPFFPMLLASGRRECGFEGLEDDFFVDALLVRDGINHHQNFLVHASYTPTTRSISDWAQPISGA